MHPAPDLDVTASFGAMRAKSIPRPLPVFTHDRRELGPFEIYLSSLVDGMRSIKELADTASISQAEVKAVLRTLIRHHMVEVDEAEPASSSEASTAIHAAPVEPAVLPPPLPAQPPAPATDRRATLRDQDLRCVDAIARADQLERAGETDQAISVLREALNQHRSAGSVYTKLALLLAGKKAAFAEAEGLLRAALRLDPEHKDYEKCLGQVLAQRAARQSEERRRARAWFAA
jgi:type IV pilus assembly protein PilB